MLSAEWFSAAAKRLRVRGDVHQPGLQGRSDGGAAGADREQQRHRGARDVRGDDERGQRDSQCRHREIEAADHRPVGQPAADHVSDDHARAEHHQRQRNPDTGPSR